MATYKVIQDIEAEDHILGPLSLRQFIFAIVAVLCFYMCYLTIVKHVSFLMVLFLPPGLFCAFFAVPFGGDQPTEVWALAKIRFFFKPRRRIWDQSGMKDLVTVTVPKKAEIRRTDGLDQSQVRSRLAALANTIDSRGWAVKDVDVNLYTQPAIIPSDSNSDRLIGTDNMPQQVPSFKVNASDDIMDAQNNPIAHQFDQMITASAAAHRQQLVGMMQSNEPSPQLPEPVGASTQQNWFMGQATPQPLAAPSLSMPTAPAASNDTAADAALLKAHHADDHTTVYGHMKTIQPLSSDQAVPAPAPQQPSQPSQAATQLAANNDLNISTIARVANKKDLPPNDEVVISLH